MNTKETTNNARSRRRINWGVQNRCKRSKREKNMERNIKVLVKNKLERYIKQNCD